MPRPGPRPYECVRRAWHSERHQPIRGSLIKEIFRYSFKVCLFWVKTNVFVKCFHFEFLLMICLVLFFRVASEIHSPATRKNKEWQEKLPVVVLKAEEIMYSKANSEVLFCVIFFTFFYFFKTTFGYSYFKFQIFDNL